MPRTAVVNPRRRRRRKKNPTRRAAPKRRRRNSGYALVEREPNRRRRRGKRRRYYGSARRRRNPSSSIARAANPAVDLDGIIDIVPAATAGVWGARWAVAQAGEFEEGKPGFKHALAIWIAASFGADVIGSVFGQGKAAYARIGALAFGGDLFLRKRFMSDSEWVQKNISLAGVDDMDQNAVYGYSQGRDYETMGAGFTDGMGNRYVQTEQGWALAGDDDGDGQLYQDEQGNVFALNGFSNSTPIGGFSNSTPIGLGRVRASSESSFGYA